MLILFKRFCLKSAIVYLSVNTHILGLKRDHSAIRMSHQGSKGGEAIGQGEAVGGSEVGQDL